MNVLWSYCFLIVIEVASALQVLVSPVVDITNGVVQRTQTLSVQCAAADFGQTLPFNITSATGSVHTMQIFCPPLQLQYSMSLVGYVPHSGQLTTRGLYTLTTIPIGAVTSASLLSTSIGEPIPEPTSEPTPEPNSGKLHHHHQQQQSQPSDSAPKLKSNDAEPLVAGKRRHGSNRLFFHFGDWVTGIACSSAGGAALVGAVSSCQGGGGGVSQADFDALKSSFNTLANTSSTRLTALEGFQNATSVWETQTTANALQTAAVTTALAQSMATASQALQQQQSINYQIQNTIDSVIVAQRTTLNQVNANIAAVNANLAADVSGLQTQIAVMFNKTYASMFALQQNLTAAINSVAQQAYYAIQV
jgi:hypothetical protein